MMTDTAPGVSQLRLLASRSVMPRGFYFESRKPGLFPLRLLRLDVYERSCSIDARRCEPLGDFYAEGRGVPRDAARAKALYKTACEKGKMQTACKKAG